MMKTKSTKRALLMSALSLLLCVSMLVGSTFAWFTDSVTSGKNTIQSGNLDVKLEYSVQKDGVWSEYAEVTSTTDIFGYNNWEPGYTAIAKFRVTNVGSLALKYQLTADVYEEIPGVNVAGQEFLLSDYLYTEVVDADATREEILASTTGKRLKAPERSDVPLTDLVVSARALEANDEEEVALAIWMPTTVGNEANHNGTNQPAISFGINLLATQQTSEKDSFNNQYDVNATYPLLAFASASTTPENSDFVEMDLLRTNGSKAGFVRFHKDSLDTDKENVSVTVIEQQSADPTVTVAADQAAKTYEITVSGLKAGNDKDIDVMLNVGTGLTGLKLYHNNTEITPIDYTNGVLTFKTRSFSPYTIVFDAVAEKAEVEGGEGSEGGEGEGNEPITEAPPKANIAPITLTETIEWTRLGEFFPANPAQQLDAVFEFTAPHTAENVDESYFADWYCDYYVTAKTDNEDLTVLPENAITLGGNYGTFGWVGFGNPEVPTNQEIPLLGSVTGGNEVGINTYWTYANVVKFVEVFKCGVAESIDNIQDLDDVEFVVELRLTNPENTEEHITAGYVTYSFANGESTVHTIVYSSEELMNAIMGGATNVMLGTNIDLNNGSIVVPAP